MTSSSSGTDCPGATSVGFGRRREPFVGGQNVEVRRTLVGVVVVLAVLGSGCSSQQPSAAVVAAQRSVRAWGSVVNADKKAELAYCFRRFFTGAPAGQCSPSAALVTKIHADEQHLMQAEAILKRAEAGKPNPGHHQGAG